MKRSKDTLSYEGLLRLAGYRLMGLDPKTLSIRNDCGLLALLAKGEETGLCLGPFWPPGTVALYCDGWVAIGNPSRKLLYGFGRELDKLQSVKFIYEKNGFKVRSHIGVLRGKFKNLVCAELPVPCTGSVVRLYIDARRRVVRKSIQKGGLQDG